MAARTSTLKFIKILLPFGPIGFVEEQNPSTSNFSVLAADALTANWKPSVAYKDAELIPKLCHILDETIRNETLSERSIKKIKRDLRRRKEDLSRLVRNGVDNEDKTRDCLTGIILSATVLLEEMKKGTLQYEPGNYEGGVRLDYVFSVDGTIKFLMEAKKPAILHVANARTEENGHGTVNLSWGDPDSQPPTLHEKILALCAVYMETKQMKWLVVTSYKHWCFLRLVPNGQENQAQNDQRGPTQNVTEDGPILLYSPIILVGGETESRSKSQESNRMSEDSAMAPEDSNMVSEGSDTTSEEPYTAPDELDITFEESDTTSGEPDSRVLRAFLALMICNEDALYQIGIPQKPPCKQVNNPPASRESSSSQDNDDKSKDPSYPYTERLLSVKREPSIRRSKQPNQPRTLQVYSNPHIPQSAQTPRILLQTNVQSTKEAPHQIIFDRFLGRGTFGVIYKAFALCDNGEEKVLAVKVVERLNRDSKLQFEALEREKTAYDSLEIQKRVFGVEITPGFHGSYANNSMKMIILDLSGDSLSTWNTLDNAEKNAVFKLFVRLHAIGYAHGDVRPQNVVKMPDGQNRVIDFSECRPHMCSDWQILEKMLKYDPQRNASGKLSCRELAELKVELWKGNDVMEICS